VGRTCNMHGGGDRCPEGFGYQAQKEETTGRS
jgi:hypothetical protein